MIETKLKIFSNGIKKLKFKMYRILTSISSLDNKRRTISLNSFSTAICNAVLFMKKNIEISFIKNYKNFIQKLVKNSIKSIKLKFD